MMCDQCKEMYDALMAWKAHIDICVGVDEDTDEGFLEMVKSRSLAITKTEAILNKIHKNNP